MGEVAPGCVLPTCGFGHHQLAARPCARGRSVAAVPMNGSMSSRMAALYLRLTPSRFRSDELIVDLDVSRPGAGDHTDQTPILGTRRAGARIATSGDTLRRDATRATVT